MQNTPFSTNKTLNINGRLVDLSIPKVMGILNVTPDSFYDGGKYFSESAMLERIEAMVTEGADFVDIGGYSSRPGAADVSEEEELSRITKAVTMTRKHFPAVMISVDTFRARVAESAIGSGADMINDISGGSLDREMFATVARLKVPYVIMHMKGTPQTMASETEYQHLVNDIISYFHERIWRLRDLEVKDIIVDPGFGFSKNIGQNFTLLNDLDKLSILGRPILVGLSRKSMIWKTLQIEPGQALNGTTALNTMALLKGADILRVHDVREARQLVKLFTSLQVNVNR